MVQLSSILVGLFSTTGVLLLMFRLFRWRAVICKCIASSEKHAVITGATSGIGRATALELARKNWKVTLGCRDVFAAEQVKQEIIATTGNRAVTVKQLDLTDRSSIECFTKTFQNLPVHALINNAGVMASSPGKVRSFGGVTTDIATNYLGTVYLTHRMIPHLTRVQENPVYYPRIIMVSSALASRGRLDDLLEPWRPEAPWNAMQAYSDSKLACCLFARELHRRFGLGPDKTLDVYCLFTGGMVNTKLNRHLLTKYPVPLQWLWSLFAKLVLKTPFEGCQSVVHCAISQDVPKAHCKELDSQLVCDASGSGLLYRNCIPIPWPDNMHDVQTAQSLWKETMHFLDIRD